MAVTASPRFSPTVGIPLFTMMPIRMRQIRLIPQSAAGCASSLGIRSSGICRSRRAWSMPWMSRKSGPSRAREKHYFTALRLYFPEYAHELAECASFADLPEKLRRNLTRELHDQMAKRIADVTEDTMP